MLAGVLVLRALDRRSWVDAGAAGAAAGLAIGIKPTNVLFLLAPLAAFAAARRWRELGAFAAAVAPCVLTYLLWRWKSVGHVGSLHDALLIPAPVQYTLSNLNIDFRFLNGLSWSPRVLEWIAVAGFIGLLKRSPVKAVFFGTWLLAYVLALGASRVTDSSGFLFWHVVSSAFPAFCVLAASVPLLWPRSMHGLSDRYSYRPRQLVPFAVPAVVAVVVPLVAVAALPRLHVANVAADLQVDNQLVPITDELHGRARVVSGRVLLSWKPASAKGVYAVYRAPARSSIEEEGLRCDRPGATRCALEMLLVATTGKTSLSEVPRPGNFTYRVAVRANYLGNDSPPGLFLSLSPPLDVDTR
jgi:hypothetical protein